MYLKQSIFFGMAVYSRLIRFLWWLWFIAPKKSLNFVLYYINKNIKINFVNTIIMAGILVEIVIVIGGIYIMKQLQKKEIKQPALSKKIIKNLKF